MNVSNLIGISCLDMKTRVRKGKEREREGRSNYIAKPMNACCSNDAFIPAFPLYRKPNCIFARCRFDVSVNNRIETMPI